jgi:Na+/H+ antiporter 1
MAATPGGASWRQLAGVATVAGIGFTVPLFIAGLAFPPGRFDAAVKLGCCSPRCSPAPAARWRCSPAGANGPLGVLDEFCAVPLPFAAR